MAESYIVMRKKVIPDRETRRILQRVYAKLAEEANTPVVSNESRPTKLTGLHPDFLKQLAKGDGIKISLVELDRADVLRKLNNFYIKNNTMPTTEKLFSACQGLIPPHMDIAAFRKLLLKLDFVWKKLPNNNFVVMERPEVTYERFAFLKRILEAKEDDVYFIEEIGYNCEDGGTVYEVYKSLPSDKEMKKMIYAVNNKEIIYNSNYEADYTEKSFKDWVAGVLMPNLRNPSVVVFNNAEHHCEMLPLCSDLTINSLKCEMTDWLDKNNIPYEDIMSKVELFSLIENCTDKYANKYLVDNILLASGHTPLRLPNQMISLTPGQYISKVIKKLVSISCANKTDSPILIPAIKVSLGKLSNFSADVFADYRSMFNRDLQVDHCLDGLLMHMDQLTCDSDHDDSDLPSLSDDSD